MHLLDDYDVLERIIADLIIISTKFQWFGPAFFEKGKVGLQSILHRPETADGTAIPKRGFVLAFLQLSWCQRKNACKTANLQPTCSHQQGALCIRKNPSFSLGEQVNRAWESRRRKACTVVCGSRVSLVQTRIPPPPCKKTWTQNSLPTRVYRFTEIYLIILPVARCIKVYFQKYTQMIVFLATAIT